MEEKRIPTTTDDCERIVNANYERRSAERDLVYKVLREYRLKKLWLTACGIALTGIVFLLLGIAGAVAGWLTALISVTSVTASSFVFGQYVEVKNR